MKKDIFIFKTKISFQNHEPEHPIWKPRKYIVWDNSNDQENLFARESTKYVQMSWHINFEKTRTFILR